MIAAFRLPLKLFWLVHKDLHRELRSRQLVTRMLMLGGTIGFLMSCQTHLAPDQLASLAPSLCWMTLAFTAVLLLGATVSQERAHGCWDAMLSFPIPAFTIYFSKLLFSSAVLALAQGVIVPLFAAMCGTSWWNAPVRLVLVLLLGNLGIAAAGTLVAFLSSAVDRSDGLLAVLLLPLLTPILIAASEATRLVDDSASAHEWRRWVQLLVAFAIVYTTVGWMFCDSIVES